MEYSFTCYGHENIKAKHKTTLEFTKDTEMGLKGDCIVGVNADFSLDKLKKLTKLFKGFNLIIQDAISAIRDFGIACGPLKKYIKKGELDG